MQKLKLLAWLKQLEQTASSGLGRGQSLVLNNPVNLFKGHTEPLLLSRFPSEAYLGCAKVSNIL